MHTNDTSIKSKRLTDRECERIDALRKSYGLPAFYAPWTKTEDDENMIL